MSEQLRRLIPQARTLITKESFRDQSFGSLDGYLEDISRPIDIAPLVRTVQTAMKIFPPRDEESDSWLAPRVHASLRLFRSEAADTGIWDFLSVVVLRDYIIWRMASEDGLVHNLDSIIGSFRHQALARLWWAAELSRNGADYHPTEEAFRSQDGVNYLTNVDAFHNRPAALAYIRFISHTNGATPIKQIAIETGMTLNHVLTTIVLDSFAPDSGGDMDAQEQWIAEAPDVTLADSVLPKGPDEPQVPEAKIRAVEELLERLMVEHRWGEVVDWSQKWIAKSYSPATAETALTTTPSPSGDISKDVAPNDDVAYENFIKALRSDLGIEPSDQTRELFVELSREPESDGSEVLKGLPKNVKPEDATPVPGLPDSVKAISRRGDETPVLEPSRNGQVESRGAHAPIDDATPASGLPISPKAISVRGDETPTLEPSRNGQVESRDTHAAIVVTAESMYEKSSPAEQTIARRILEQLTELGEGTQDTPRASTLEELIRRPEEALPVEAMLKMLADAHLITMDEDLVQLADAALIREWQRLHEWLNADREGIRLHRLLTKAAREWEMSQRDPSALYRGTRLALALEWIAADELSIREEEFLNASKEFAAHEEQSLAEAETRRAEQEHRAAMKWRRRALYLAAATVIISALTAILVYSIL